MLEFFLKFSEMITYGTFVLYFWVIVTSPIWASFLVYKKSKQNIKKRLVLINGGKLLK
ncbi:hypothetical protein ACNQFZ_02090 [Schinkia sp. CFF1]